MQVSSKGDIPPTIISVLLQQVPEAPTSIHDLTTPSSHPSFVTPSSSLHSSAGKTNTDMPKNLIDNQGIWSKEVIKCLEKKTRVLPKLNTTASPQGPTMTSLPGSSASCHAFPITSSSLLNFCACSMLWERNKRKIMKGQSVIWEGAIAHFLEMTHNIPQVPDDHVVKCMQIWQIWRWSDAILNFLRSLRK